MRQRKLCRYINRTQTNKLRSEGIFMTEKPKQPERHSDLRDPKLPAINGGVCGNRAEGRVRNETHGMYNAKCDMMPDE